jgi:hypothetical protein
MKLTHAQTRDFLRQAVGLLAEFESPDTFVLPFSAAAGFLHDIARALGVSGTDAVVEAMLTGGQKARRKRNAEIKRRRIAGEGLAPLALEFGITRQRVVQIAGPIKPKAIVVEHVK